MSLSSHCSGSSTTTTNDDNNTINNYGNAEEKQLKSDQEANIHMTFMDTDAVLPLCTHPSFACQRDDLFLPDLESDQDSSSACSENCNQGLRTPATQVKLNDWTSAIIGVSVCHGKINSVFLHLSLEKKNA